MTGLGRFRRFAASIGAMLLAAAPALAQNATLEISEETLNRVATRLGDPSDSGIYQPKHPLQLPAVFDECAFFGFIECPGFPGFTGGRIPLARCWKKGGGIFLVPSGEPVAWQWWIEDPEFLLGSGAMQFRASVRWRIGAEEGVSGPHTVATSVSFSAASNRLNVNVGSFTIPLQAVFDGQAQTVTTVDVARLYSLSIPVEPQAMTLPLPGGGSRTISPRIVAATPNYQAGKVKIDLNLGF